MKIKPLRDYICIKPFRYQHPVLYVAGIELHRGEVVAVGPGRRVRRKVAYKRHEQNSDSVQYFEDGPETGEVLPVKVKVGDIVEYGFRDLREVDLGGEKYVMIKAKGIYGVSKDKSRHKAVLEARSAAVPV